MYTRSGSYKDMLNLSNKYLIRASLHVQVTFISFVINLQVQQFLHKNTGDVICPVNSTTNVHNVCVFTMPGCMMTCVSAMASLLGSRPPRHLHPVAPSSVLGVKPRQVPGNGLRAAADSYRGLSTGVSKRALQL
jgi:hypothetical protein